MNYPTARQESITVIQNVLIRHKDSSLSRLVLNLANEGKLTQLVAQQIENNDADTINSLTEYQLCILYDRLSKYVEEMPKTSKFFTDIEIRRCEELMENNIKDKFPFVFNNCRKIMPNKEVYRCDISYQDLYYFLTSGAIRVEEGLQRESEYTTFKGKVISNVRFNPDVPPKIMECILKYEFYPTDEFKFHLLSDGEDEIEIDENDKTLTIKSGNMFLLDGQHRSRAIQMAYAKNPNIDLTFSFIFSYGTKEMAQGLLAQHEMRQPISKKIIRAYTSGDASDIFRRFYSDNEIQSEFTFIDDSSAINAGVGFIYKSDVLYAIESYYVKKDMLKYEKNEIARWMAEFFDILYELWEIDYRNYKEVYNNKWNVNSFAYNGLIYLSAQLMNLPNRNEKAKKYVQSLIDMNLEVGDIKGKNKVKAFKKVVEEALRDGC